jgi:hypothetical protein
MRRKYLSLRDLVSQDPNSLSLVSQKLEQLESRGLVNNDQLQVLKDEFKGIGIRHIDHSRAIDALVSLEMILELVEKKK